MCYKHILELVKDQQDLIDDLTKQLTLIIAVAYQDPNNLLKYMKDKYRNPQGG